MTASGRSSDAPGPHVTLPDPTLSGAVHPPQLLHWISLDPRFALAHAYFALALLLEHGFEFAPDAIKDRALDSARIAVRLDPREAVRRRSARLGMAHFAPGPKPKRRRNRVAISVGP